MTRGKVFLLSVLAAAVLLVPAIAWAQSCPCSFVANGQRTFKDNRLTCWGVLDGPIVPTGSAGIDAIKVARNGSTDIWEYYVSDSQSSAGMFCSISHFKCRDASCRESVRDRYGVENMTSDEFNACANELQSMTALAPHNPLVLSAPNIGDVEISGDSCAAATTLDSAALAQWAVAWNEDPAEFTAEDFFPSSLLQSPAVVAATAGVLTLPGVVLVGLRRRRLVQEN